ncbi:nuclear pore complex protein Nup160-like [Acipenser oxyrinchus oxyrinchus]|uniref:Nuclear pore complex protein Nup160-like n=1 Tax=Acipenser oxyrinchus oxyrinchus TaxID=40147 RepID=A0AAD8CZS0_ACIOX|nr:nuclear pore complex protein Nup160-like [Acipenser oxyrinchus oxyrinchus]
MAAVLERSFLEICGFERETVQRFRDITVNPGVNSLPGAVKYPDSAGGFYYEESGKLLSVTSNRFIHWTTSGDALQLVEQSLDTNLLNNAVRLRIVNCNLLPGGVHLQETQSHVIILIVTNQSVHRLVLPHPSRMYRSELVTETQMQSVFTDIGKVDFRDPQNSYVIPSIPGQFPNSTASTAWLSSEGEALFALPSTSGGILIIKLPPHDVQGSVSILELKQSSVMQRFLTGWMPTAIRGDQGPSDLPLSLAVRQLENDAFIFALCQDHKLRMWSYKDQMCLMVADMMEYMPVNRDVKYSSGQGHKLRLSFSPSTGLCLGVYLAVPKRGQFCVFQLVSTESNRYSLDHISSLFATQETLIDFSLTSTDVWALWQDDENQTIVKYINFEHNQAAQWNQVFVQPPPAEEVTVGEEDDPREAYLGSLFSPSQFTTTALVKALQIYRRGGEKILDLSWEALKKEVTVAVENELQGSVTEYEFSQEEYRQLQVEFWSKFYACCLQYQEALSSPLALHVNPRTAMVCLLKKGYISFLIPCFAVDHLYLCSEGHLSNEEEETPVTDDPDTARDILQLVQCLRLIRESVTEEMACVMEKALEHMQSPERAAEQVLECLLGSDHDNVIEDVQNKMQAIQNPVNAMTILLREMNYEIETPMEDNLGAVQPLNVRMSLSQLFGSSAAVHLVGQAVCQNAMTRFLLCRDLLILQQLYLHLGGEVYFGEDGQLYQLQQDLVSRTSHCLCSYYLVRWASRCLSTAVPMDTLEANLQHLSVLDMSDSPALTPNKSVSSPQTVVELFFQTVARKRIIYQIYAQPDTPLTQAVLNWSELIAAISVYLLQHLWPSNPGFLFLECMMGNCQYTQLQEHIRLISPWCQVNVGSCRFVLGQCYLATGEGHKALQCFQEAATEVGKEEFLDRLIGGSDEEEAASAPRLQYYNKVLRLLEDVGLPELVIQLSTMAISEATDVRSQAALQTRIFKHHLDLGHNKQAYEALTQNPDPCRQLDCLRQLVVVLCERSQLHDLVEFPYVNLHDEVVTIIESRARAVDLMTHNYYELLYAFHINRHNYRKAGTVMFEYGMRLGREVRTLNGLQKQVNCYLCALNCLRLIRPEYAWIVQPASGGVYERPGASPKRNYDGECAANPAGRRIEILELKDLQKEYILARNRMTLAQHDPNSAAIAGNASAVEMVALLVQAGLFDAALSLCQTFQLSLPPVFEGLAFKCIKLQYGGEAIQSEAWDWLAANQLSSVISTKESSATDEAWRLLSSYLERYKCQNGQYHRCVINKLLSHGVPIPNWLVNCYKEIDAAGLLRLYLNYDLLEEAAELVLEFVDALLGKGHQYFGIERPLSATAPLVWLPYLAIDQLLQALGENQSNINNANLYQKLQDKLALYYKHVSQATIRRQQNA